MEPNQNIDINIHTLCQTAQNQRIQSRDQRLSEYIIARDDLFHKLINNAKTKMSMAAQAGHYRAILLTGKRQQDGLYPNDMFFGSNEIENRKGIPFPSVWNPQGIPEEHTLLTKLYKSFHIEKNQNLRFYVKKDLRDLFQFHVFIDWNSNKKEQISETNTVKEGGYIQPRSRSLRHIYHIDSDGFIIHQKHDTNKNL